jgi:hypothetical protein
MDDEGVLSNLDSVILGPKLRGKEALTGSSVTSDQSRPTQALGPEIPHYNDPLGPGGVCGAPSAAAPVTVAVHSPSPLVPDQPLPPGAPEALSPGAAPEPTLSTQSTDLSTEESITPNLGAKKSTVQHPDYSQAPDPKLGATKRKGIVHPYKPVTPEQISAFAQMWHDAGYTVPQIAKRFHAAESSIGRWAREFGLRERDEVFRDQARANSVLSSAAEVVGAAKETAAVTRAMAMAPAASAVGEVVPPENKWDPLKDREIAQGLEEIREQAKIMTAHSDLTSLQRQLAKFSVLIATKMPVYTWQTLQMTVDGLARAILWNRRVEAEIPAGQADPILLRKEAAAQLMKELKSALGPEDQAKLAEIMKRGVDKMMEGKVRAS